MFVTGTKTGLFWSPEKEFIDSFKMITATVILPLIVMCGVGTDVVKSMKCSGFDTLWRHFFDYCR